MPKTKLNKKRKAGCRQFAKLERNNCNGKKSKNFNTESTRDKHSGCNENVVMKLHQFNCNACDEIFEVYTEFKTHWRNVHECQIRKSPTFTYGPKSASPVFLTPSSIGKFETSNDVRQTVCRICSHMLSSTGSLKRHMLLHNREAPFKCHLCKSSYFEPSTLCSHINRFHIITGSAKHSRSKICDCVVKSRQCRHYLTYSRKQAYRCQICPESFECESAVEIHYNETHCDKKSSLSGKCSNAFVQLCDRSNIGAKKDGGIICDGVAVAHKNRSKKMPVTSSNRLRYFCDQCPAYFFRKKKLKMHLKLTHENAAMLPCQFCDNSFHSEILDSHLFNCSSGEQKPKDSKNNIARMAETFCQNGNGEISEAVIVSTNESTLLKDPMTVEKISALPRNRKPFSSKHDQHADDVANNDALMMGGSEPFSDQTALVYEHEQPLPKMCVGYIVELFTVKSVIDAELSKTCEESIPSFGLVELESESFFDDIKVLHICAECFQPLASYDLWIQHAETHNGVEELIEIIPRV